MKTLAFTFGFLAWIAVAAAGTSINATNRFAYGANLGWLDWRGDTNDGVVIGEYVCSGYLYAANLGWIHLGNGSPPNGIRYRNDSATDYGVNHDGLGNLHGFAFGPNLGWVSFESNGLPRVDLQSGRLSGSVYSANCGWISLNNLPIATLQTDFISPGADSDRDGITDAWELSYTNTLASLTSSTDADGDGVSDLHEHLANTNPFDANDYLRIVDYTVDLDVIEKSSLTWTSSEARRYRIEYRTNLNAGASWTDPAGIIAPDAGTNTSRSVTFGVVLPERYFRINAFKPLSP